MKSPLLVSLLLIAVSIIAQEQAQPRDPNPRWTKAQKYSAEGFHPIDCFAGVVKVQRKRVTRQSVSVFAPNAEKKCCAHLVKNTRTDDHGHFSVEPLEEGEYFAKFEYKGAQYVADIAIIRGYERCSEVGHIEITFTDVDKAKIQSFVDINDSGDECQASEPNCFRK
jgi:hypothetical protein